MEKQKIYQKSWFMWVMLVLFYPVGLFLLWKYSTYSKKVNAIITGIFALIIVIGMFSSDKKVVTTSTQSIEQKQVTKFEYSDQQKQAVIKWYKNIKSDMDVADQKWHEWKTIMDSISNNSLSTAVAAQKLDALYNEMDSIAKTIDHYDAPEGLPDNSKKKLNQSILQLGESIKSRRGACMTLRDALNNGTLKDSKVEIIQNKLKGAQNQMLKGMANIADVTTEMDIDITKL